MRWSLAHSNLGFMRSEKLFLAASSVAAVPVTGLPYGGMKKKASSAEGKLPCLMAFSVQGPVWAWANAQITRVKKNIRLKRIGLTSSYSRRDLICTTLRRAMAIFHGWLT